MFLVRRKEYHFVLFLFTSELTQSPSWGAEVELGTLYKVLSIMEFCIPCWIPQAIKQSLYFPMMKYKTTFELLYPRRGTDFRVCGYGLRSSLTVVP